LERCAIKLNNKLKPYYVEIFILLFYFIALFPGRPSYDVGLITEMMKNGESAATWSATYFRLMQLLTFNGNILSVASAIGMVVFYFSFLFLMQALPFSNRIQIMTRRVVVALPIFSIFALTVNHDVFAVSGTFLLVGLLIKNKPLKKKYLVILIFAGFLTSMSWLGIAAFLGFIFSIIIKRRYKEAILSFTLITAFVLGSLLILNVDPGPSNRWLPIVGDLKCVAQDPDSKITQAQWDSLILLAPKNEWLDPASCVIADFAPDVAEKNISINPLKSIKLCAQLLMTNQKTIVEAHLQRASVALPPLFSAPPPNPFSTDYLSPIGQGVPANLFQFSEFLSTGRHTGQYESSPNFLKPIEIIILTVAHLFNRTSYFWGWGGLWLLLSYFFFPFIFKKRNLHALNPLLFTHILMLLASPGPVSRYVYASIITGITISVGMLVVLFEKSNKLLGNTLEPDNSSSL
jgi:hypothetical protein